MADTVAPGTYTVQVTASNNDATPQSGTCSFTVTVSEIKPIGEVQGSVAGNGFRHRSPFAPASGNGGGQTVFIKGVVYEKTLARTSAGANQHGIFIQNTAAQADGGNNRVTVGFRPEDTELVGEGEHGMPITVDLVEELGSDAYIYGTVALEGQNERFVVRTDPRKAPGLNDTVFVRPRADSHHAFHSQNGLRI